MLVIPRYRSPMLLLILLLPLLLLLLLLALLHCRDRYANNWQAQLGDVIVLLLIGRFLRTRQGPRQAPSAEEDGEPHLLRVASHKL